MEADAAPPESTRLAAAEPSPERTDEPAPSELRGDLTLDEVAPPDALEPEPYPAPEQLVAEAAVGERLDAAGVDAAGVDAAGVDAAPLPSDVVPEHVEIDFDWDTLPDEEA